jgi:GNAT superfamily N-acetyltransferase
MIHIRTLTTADLAFGMRLKEQAGWNQLQADWQRLLALEPEGFFLAEQHGVPIGTVATCRFGSVGWIAMMLVAEPHRGKGIGRGLMEQALAYLDARGVKTVRLDATALGRPLYEKLGFSEDFTLDRYAGTLMASPTPHAARCIIEPAGPGDTETILRLDQEATRTERGRLIQHLLAEFPENWWVARDEGEVVGSLTGRPGARAWFVGPCLAREEVGTALIHEACVHWAGRDVFIDIPHANRAALTWASAQGLKVQRPLIRMSRGPRLVEDLDCLWASSGPEKG